MNSGSWYWPDVSNMDGAKDACRMGGWFAVIVAIVTAIFALLALAGTRLMGITSAALVDAILFGAIAFGIFKHSRFAAVAGFALYLLEKLYAISQQGVLAAGVLGVIFLIGFLNAIRGTFAYHKLLAEQAKSAPVPFS
jgi:hypothetical protein